MAENAVVRAGIDDATKNQGLWNAVAPAWPQLSAASLVPAGLRSVSPRL